MMTDKTERVAMAIFWAAYEMYPPTPGNPVSRMAKEAAWEKASSERRDLSRFQARRALEQIEEG